MKIEHLGFNIADPVAMAAWYCKNCGFKIVRQLPGPAKAHFIADGGASVLEIYNNPAAPVPDYKNMDPLLFHLALDSADPTADATRLIAAGATLLNETKMDDGSHLFMLRDPWGLAVQLVRRAKPLL